MTSVVFLLTIGSYDSTPGPRGAHTWACLDMIQPDGSRERFTISWMPRGRFRLLDGPGPGENWTEERTLEHAKMIGAKVKTWGPYPVSTDTAARFVRRLDDLQEGRLQYTALDLAARPGATNCIHAVSDIYGGQLRTGLAYGRRASALVAGHVLHHERRKVTR